MPSPHFRRVFRVQLVMPFLGKFPELYKWFKDFLGYEESGKGIEAIPTNVARIQAAEKPGVEHATEIGEEKITTTMMTTTITTRTTTTSTTSPINNHNIHTITNNQQHQYTTATTSPIYNNNH